MTDAEDMTVPQPLRVVVAGGGFAAAEALLALRAQAEERVELELITPDRRLAFRPQATSAVFGDGEVQAFDLGELAESVGARLRDDAIRSVAPAARKIALASGGQTDYDALVLAIGARARVGVPGAVTFRDQRDIANVRALLDDVRSGLLHRLVFTAPAGVTWMLPLYELALQAAAEIEEHGLDADVTVVTPEQRPLEVFGLAASATVAELLRDHGVRVRTSTVPRAVEHGGLSLVWGGTIEADAVVAVPVLSGRRIPGVPGNFSGFVRTDERARVVDIDRVWAAGDMTDCPIKQGGLAAQQADLAAADIAALAGAPVDAAPAPQILRAQLVGGREPLFLRAELGRDGAPVDAGVAISGDAPWWPTAKVFGRHVAPWMAGQALEVVA